VKTVETENMNMTQVHKYAKKLSLHLKL